MATTGKAATETRVLQMGGAIVPLSVAAAALRVPIDTLRRRVVCGRVAGHRRGARWYVSLEELLAALNDEGGRPDAA